MAEEKTPQEETLEEEKEEFKPPIRQREEESEEKKFWYALRKMGSEVKEIKQMVSRRDGEGEGYREELPEEHDDILDKVERRNASLLSEMEKRDRDREVKDFVRDNPNFAKYQDKIQKSSMLPEMRNINVDFIAKAYAFEDAEKLGAEKRSQADNEAQSYAMGGNPVRPSKGGEDYNSMSDEEFDKKVNQTLQNQ